MKFSDFLSMRYRSTLQKPKMAEYIYDYCRIPLLKNKVRGQEMKNKEVACLNELQAFIVCLKKFDFDDAPCKQFLDTLNSCRDLDRKMKMDNKAMVKSGGLLRIENDELPLEQGKKYHTIRINRMLKKYPTPPQPDAYYYKD